MPDPIVSWLLEENNPSVRYFTLTSLLDRSPDDPQVRNTRKSIMEQGVVPKILGMQNEDGSWGAPERFYTDKYRGTVWTILLLAEMGADSVDSRIQRACEYILEHSRNSESGGFAYTQSTKTGSGLASVVIPCLTGNMGYSLIKLGYVHDERLQKAIEWITRYQRADDGAKKAPEVSVYERFEMCWGRHSCQMGVAKALKALAAIPPDLRKQENIEKMNELTEYFLKHHLYRKSHNLGEIARPGWLRLGFPLMYQTDILELLKIFDDLKIRDPRLQDPLKILKDKQRPDGTWKFESSNNGKMLVNIEKKGLPSKWITLKARKVLRGVPPES